MVRTLLFVFLVSMLTPALFVHAAELSFDTEINTLAVDDIVVLQLFLDPEDVSVNTLAATIVVPERFTITELSYGDSVVSLWVERPTIDGHTISFAGLMPGGFQGVTSASSQADLLPGKVLELSLKALAVGTDAIELKDVTLLLNDGSGTQTAVSVLPRTLTVTAEVKGQEHTAAQVEDIEPPLPFTIEVLYSDVLASPFGYYAFFHTEDALSGVDYFEVREGDGEWQLVESPYRLTDQELRRPIQIKAVDRAGNTYIARWDPPRESSPRTHLLFVLAILGFGGVMVYAVHRFRRRV